MSKRALQSEHNKVIVSQIKELVKQLEYPLDEINPDKANSRYTASQRRLDVRYQLLGHVIAEMVGGFKFSDAKIILSSARSKVEKAEEDLINSHRYGEPLHDVEDLYSSLNDKFPTKRVDGRVVVDYSCLKEENKSGSQ